MTKQNKNSLRDRINKVYDRCHSNCGVHRDDFDKNAHEVIKELEAIISIQAASLEEVKQSTSLGSGHYPEKKCCEINNKVTEALEKSNKLMNGGEDE